MIDSTFIQKILDLAPAQKVELGGKEYFTREVNIPPEPTATTLKLSTLSSLVDFVTNEFDFNPDEAFIHIDAPCTVRLMSLLHGRWKERDCFVKVEHTPASFIFGNFYEQEEFIIKLQSQFIPYGDRDHVLELVSGMKDSAEQTSLDNGVNQSVVAKAGVALVKEVPVKNPVTLAPYRTFREIRQPSSQFILRIRKTNGKPACALFEAEGGNWMIDAVQLIKKYFDGKVTLPVLG